jgi:hypothetical protein
MNTLVGSWRKSSRSSDQTNCVELRNDLLAVRDSKNPAGQILAVSAQDLVAAVRAGRIS